MRLAFVRNGLCMRCILLTRPTLRSQQSRETEFPLRDRQWRPHVDTVIGFFENVSLTHPAIAVASFLRRIDRRPTKRTAIASINHAWESLAQRKRNDADRRHPRSGLGP